MNVTGLMRPFHPVGLANTWGGVEIHGRRVCLWDPATVEIAAEADLPWGMGPADLYLRGKLFELFPGETWYTGSPWVGTVEVCILRLEREAVVDGVLAYHRAGGEAGRRQTWEATVRYGGFEPAWDIRVPLPVDHDVPGDVVFRVRVARVIHRLLGGMPAQGRPGDTVTAGVSNLFGDTTPFHPLPFFVHEVGSHPLLYLERAYAWSWDHEL